jgi:hypothetical protein
MSDQSNPYAPPRADIDFHAGFGGSGAYLRREGDLVVIPVQGAVFPPRCVVCNSPANHRLRRKLYWHPPGYYALICIGVLIYAVVALIVRKSTEFEVGLCDEHSGRRRTWILLGWLGVPACFVGAILLAQTAPELMLLGMLVAFGLMIAAIVMVNFVTVRRIDGGQAWIKVGRRFLDSL